MATGGFPRQPEAIPAQPVSPEIILPGVGARAGDDPAVGPDEALDGDTRERLIEATDRLVRTIGFGKTSMADVARSARVARGTLYRYFDSRETLFDAVMKRTGDRFFTEAAGEMGRRETLSEQLGAFSELLTRWIHPRSGDPSKNRAAMLQLLATQGGAALGRTAAFLWPYLEAARTHGEVREDLDVRDASEWLARILLSFTVFQASVSYEAGDPRSVGDFVRRYAIDGLSGPAAPHARP
jgi:AcrR family transcriptional regulator